MIFDAHSDVLSDVTIRTLRGESNILKKYHYNNLVKGKVGGSIFVVWVEPENYERAFERANEILECTKKEITYCNDVIKIVKSYDEMINAQKENKFYAFLGFESLIAIDENIDILDRYYDDYGIRHASLTWNEENKLATGAKGDSGRGLTELGKK